MLRYTYIAYLYNRDRLCLEKEPYCWQRSVYWHAARKLLYTDLCDVVLDRQLRYWPMDFSAFIETNTDWDSSEM